MLGLLDLVAFLGVSKAALRAAPAAPARRTQRGPARRCSANAGNQEQPYRPLHDAQHLAEAAYPALVLRGVHQAAEVNDSVPWADQRVSDAVKTIILCPASANAIAELHDGRQELHDKHPGLRCEINLPRLSH
jgi:hypothetical protein